LSGLSKATDSSGIDKGVELRNSLSILKNGSVSKVGNFDELPYQAIAAILHALFEGGPGIHLNGGVVV